MLAIRRYQEDKENRCQITLTICLTINRFIWILTLFEFTTEDIVAAPHPLIVAANMAGVMCFLIEQCILFFLLLRYPLDIEYKTVYNSDREIMICALKPNGCELYRLNLKYLIEKRPIGHGSAS